MSRRVHNCLLSTACQYAPHLEKAVATMLVHGKEPTHCQTDTQMSAKCRALLLGILCIPETPSSMTSATRGRHRPEGPPADRDQARRYLIRFR